MGKKWKNWLLTALIPAVMFALSLIVDGVFQSDTMIPTLFVLGVFLVALMTEGYLCGIVAALISVLAVNFAFTFPYFRFNFTMPENLFSAMVMLVIAGMTSALTTQVKQQEKIKADSEREAMRANLLRAVSHDLRTPLTTIIGATSVLKDSFDRLDRQQQMELLGGIQEDAQWLVRMVENLLSVTRIDGGNLRLIKTDTVLEELIDSVLEKFHKSYPDQAVEVQIPDEFIIIPMDAVLIIQVLSNLLENAVEHARGMTRLELTVRTEDRKAVFLVRDDGCGIAADRMDELFTGYLGSATSRSDSKRRNMGIGLSVCATIIKAHGGQIQAKNRAAGGAEFRFSLDMEE